MANVLLVGLGKMGLLHLRTVQRLGGVSVAAVVDCDPAKAALAAEHGVPFLPAWDGAAADAAIIATPSATHLAVTLPLLAAGIPCLVEKPMAPGMAESRFLVEAAEQGGALLAVAHGERFNPGVEAARQALRHRAGRAHVYRWARAAGSVHAGMDVVQDLMVHDLDWVLHALGDAPRQVKVLRALRNGAGLDALTCELLFPAGQAVVLEANRVAPGRRRAVILQDGAGSEVVSLEHAIYPGPDPLTRQARAFLAALRGQPSAVATGREALQVMSLVERLREEGERFDGAQVPRAAGAGAARD